jgi:hypothetical protein
MLVLVSKTLRFFLFKIKISLLICVRVCCFSSFFLFLGSVLLVEGRLREGLRNQGLDLYIEIMDRCMNTPRDRLCSTDLGFCMHPCIWEIKTT